MRLLLALFLLTGCAPLGVILVSGLISGGGFVGYQHSKQGGISTVWNDRKIVKRIHNLWKESEIDEPFLEVYSLAGSVVLIGAASSADNLERARTIAMTVNPNIYSIADTKIGRWNDDLALRIKLKLLADFDIASRNYHIRAIGSRVWIVGLTSKESEKGAILAKISQIDGVSVVYDYIKLIDAE